MKLKIYRRKWLRWPEDKRCYFNRYLTMRTATFKDWIYWNPEELYCFIAEIDGEPAGMALVFDSSCKFNNSCAGVYIRPKFRRKGIGYKLLLKVCKKFPKAVVAHHNKQSFKLFSKFNKKRHDREHNWLRLRSKK